MKTYKGAELLVKALQDEGVDTVFTLPGFFIMDILYFLKKSKIKVITCRNELSAAFAADGYARSSGKIGCVIVNTGPSCLNTVMALKTSQKDGIPVVMFIGTDVYSRMRNETHFQVVNFPSEITKHKFILKAENLYNQIKTYFKFALTIPTAPIVLEIPLDVSKSLVNYSNKQKNGLNDFLEKHENNCQDIGSSKLIDQLIGSLNKANKPLFVLGAGAVDTISTRLIKKFVEKYNIPFVTTFAARGIISESHKMFVGMPGTIGNLESNKSLKESDLIIALGTRLSNRFLSDSDISKKLVYQININKDHIRNDLNVAPILTDVSLIMKSLIRRNDINIKKLWNKNNNQYHLTAKSKDWGITSSMGVLLKAIKKAIIFCDDGTYTVRLWQMAKVDKPRKLLFSGNMASGGHSIPGAIGAKMANLNEKVVVITGDGGLLSIIGELQVYSENNLGILIVVFNNNSYDSITQWSHSYNIGFENSIKNADFSIIANGFGIESYKVTSLARLQTIIKNYKWDHPLFLELIVPSEKVEIHFPRFPG